MCVAKEVSCWMPVEEGISRDQELGIFDNTTVFGICYLRGVKVSNRIGCLRSRGFSHDLSKKLAPASPQWETLFLKRQ